MSLHELQTPALLVDADRVERNIARMARKVAGAGIALRPHFKTSKMLEVARMQRAAGAIGMTCATSAEVRALQDDGVERIMWGHQVVGAANVAFAIEANRRSEVIVAIDGVEAARALGEQALAAEQVVPYAIEVDTGLRRSGVEPQDAVGLARALKDIPGLRLVGLMTHEGHVQSHLGDRDALMAAALAASRALVGAGKQLREAGFDAPLVSVGSTAASTLAPFEPGVTEARPGTYVFYDANQVTLGSAHWEDCAVTILARVVSCAKRGAPVIDAGLKALSGDRAIRGVGHGYVVGLGAIVRHAYEEHGVLEGLGGERLSVGDLVQIVPNHVCGAVNMWSRAVVVRDGEVAGAWDIVARR